MKTFSEIDWAELKGLGIPALFQRINSGDDKAETLEEIANFGEALVPWLILEGNCFHEDILHLVQRETTLSCIPHLMELISSDTLNPLVRGSLTEILYALVRLTTLEEFLGENPSHVLIYRVSAFRLYQSVNERRNVLVRLSQHESEYLQSIAQDTLNLLDKYSKYWLAA